MVDQEDGEEFILDIVNDIVESTMKVLHDQYIVSQTLPYTIQETKNLLLQIIEVIVHLIDCMCQWLDYCYIIIVSIGTGQPQENGFSDF